MAPLAKTGAMVLGKAPTSSCAVRAPAGPCLLPRNPRRAGRPAGRSSGAERPDMSLILSISRLDCRHLRGCLLQNLRSVLQKHLKGRMGTTGATFVRFGFGLPFAWLFLAGLVGVLGRPLPVPDAVFALWAVIGGLSQIAATFLLVHLFSFRNFAVGTAYSRTEPAQAALFGLSSSAETVSAAALLAIAISVAGVMAISVARTPFGRPPC